jgi:hypothetical protein
VFFLGYGESAAAKEHGLRAIKRDASIINVKKAF